MRKTERTEGVHTLGIGTLELGGVVRVVLGVAEDTPLIRDAISEGIDILEVRVDQLKRLERPKVIEEIKKLKMYGLPIIGTVRRREEGADVDLSGSRRADLYEAILPFVDAIDTELSSLPELAGTVSAARKARKGIVLSYHNFSETPTEVELERIVERANTFGNHVITKIATFARNTEDVLRLLQFTNAHRTRNVVTIALGARGSISRLMFPLAGSLMTYTSVSPAHGQLAPQQFIEDLRMYYPDFNEEVIGRHRLLQYG